MLWGIWSILSQVTLQLYVFDMNSMFVKPKEKYETSWQLIRLLEFYYQAFRDRLLLNLKEPGNNFGQCEKFTLKCQANKNGIMLSIMYT